MGVITIPDNCLSVIETARRLQRSEKTIYGYLEKGVFVRGRVDRLFLNGIKIGGSWLIPPEAIEEFIEQQNPRYQQVELKEESERRQERRNAATARLRKKLGLN